MTPRDPAAVAAEATALLSKTARERNDADMRASYAEIKISRAIESLDGITKKVAERMIWQAVQEVVEVFESDSYDHPKACHGAHQVATFLANRPHHYGICHPDAWELV